MSDSPSSFELSLKEFLACLEAEASGKELSQIILQLKKRFPFAQPQDLALAAEVFVSRKAAAEKLGPWAKEGFFSKAVLEQASRASIAAWRASFFHGSRHVIEVGTGSGSDAAALGRVAGRVTTIESDSRSAELARRNIELVGVSNVSVVVGDAQDVVPALLPSCDALFADPARRNKEGARFKSGEEYSPPLSWLLGLDLPPVCAIKVSPGLFVEPCPPGWTRQFVGAGDECLEQTLWRGVPVADSSVALADLGVTWAPEPKAQQLPLAEELSGFIYEAHSVINRSQKLSQFFSQQGIRQVDGDVAYGVSSSLAPSSPLLSRFSIIEALPFSIKRLRPRLKALGWTNRTEFKKRSVKADPEGIRRELGLPEHSHGAPFGVVFAFPWQGKAWAVLAERLSD